MRANVDVPHVEWPDFRSGLEWRQGQHVINIGPNGSGKTVVTKHLMLYRAERRGFMCAVATKPKDEELEALVKPPFKFQRCKTNKNWGPTSYPRLLLWPPAGNFDKLHVQRTEFRKALQGMWDRGRWTMFLNELRYLTEHLKMRQEMNTLYLQCRSSKVSLVGETQRPRFVPLESFSQASHCFFFACRDDEDLKRISGIGNADPKVIRKVITELDLYEFCYVNARSGEICVSKATPFDTRKAA